MTDFYFSIIINDSIAENNKAKWREKDRNKIRMIACVINWRSTVFLPDIPFTVLWKSFRIKSLIRFRVKF